jgi:hypothetical protein
VAGAAIVLMFVGAGAPTVDRPVAIIANSEVPVHDLSFAEVRKIFLGDRQFWNSELRIALLVPGWQAAERRMMLQRICEKDEVQYRHYWIAKVFTTEVVAAPKVVSSPEVTARLVREIRGAVALIDASQIPPGVRVLSIDGRQPGEPGYPLQ